MMSNPRTIVIKFGTGILTQAGSVRLEDEQFERLVKAVAGLHADGHRCIVVSSGAVGAGLMAFGLAERPVDTGMLQACAAVGQSRLMHFYESLFRQYELHVAQLLVTNADFQTDSRRRNFQNTLLHLLGLPRVIPIINENDSVATEELRFGDNDALSAGVAALAGADLLLLLTSVDGLCDGDGRVIASAGSVDDVLHLVRGDIGQLSVGGMRTKLEAVRAATAAGVEVVIANGRRPEQIADLAGGGGLGTRFAPGLPAERRRPLHRDMSSLQEEIHRMGARAKGAARALARLNSARKNSILEAMAVGVLERAERILAANARDLEAGEQKGLTRAMLDRLRLDRDRLEGIAGGLRQVAALPDPIGEVIEEWDRPNGLKLRKVRVPIGVIGIIYESRPNVTSDAAALCFKTSNATILRGGSEAIHSNMALAAALQEAGSAEGLPSGSIQLVPFTDRESVRHMAEMDECIDLIIPRGGQGLIETVVSLARMPVIKHYDGICHVYLDKSADPDMARQIVIDAKCQKPSVCNAAETLLVHRDAAPELLPSIGAELEKRGVELRADDTARSILGNGAKPASDDDWTTEYLDLILAVKVVDDLDDAIDHINRFGSHHTDAIVTSDEPAARKFFDEVDSAALFWNASTRFSDGEEFGFGAEIGISTDKLHARGPMGLRELTSYKYLVTGKGQTKAPV